MDKDTEDERPVNRHDLLFLTKAYNRHELSLEEWLAATKAWAEAMVRQHGEGCYTEDTSESSNADEAKKAPEQ